MKAALICHSEDALNLVATARWLASFTELVGIVEIREGQLSLWRRVQREIRRCGRLRFLDVIAYRLYYRLFLASADKRREQEILAGLCARYPELTTATRILTVHSPNDATCEQFLRECAPDIILARCKVLLREEVFTLARTGTFVLHPGVCPEYRNAHGCFWALARRDLSNVGLTLLKIDTGIDTGPVYSYYSYPFDEVAESHIIIQHRVCFENLDAIGAKLQEIQKGTAKALDTTGRKSNVWGQPWLSSYLRWKREARRAR